MENQIENEMETGFIEQLIGSGKPGSDTKLPTILNYWFQGENMRIYFL